MTPPLLRLKPGRDESVLRRHPWIFAGAVARVEGAPAAGETVEVRSAQGKFVARAAYNSQSQIAGRIWTWDEAEAVDADFFRRRIEQAIARRTELISQTDAARWVNAENDGLPGVIVDRYGTFVVCQFLSAGVERWKSEIAGILASQEGVAGVFERSDADVRTKEGLASATGVLSGDAPPELIEIREGSSKYLVDVHHGHKTGFYLDQR
ncbi:23S rRNA (cytosine(1962)-C(5))-methyltransferase RlmI, partial [Candidatus Sumerlaeota bacterium]|nr:23S rRNA (cytosine(1962)-C(5))-methyltransferase RlmI [Candidatus Sumerlaeota bacterium]